MITVSQLVKHYGDILAVNDLSFEVARGIVTAFLGPNGAGKSTTMRLITGRDRATSGSALVNGRSLIDHPAPLTEIGSLLEPGAVEPKRSAHAHLLALATTNGIGRRRVDEVLDLVGLSDVAGRPAGQFSLGMSQRLGIAGALLGDPDTIMLDEPMNGLDPEGIQWMRGLLRHLADEGRTVFVSSHLMSEMALIADHFIIIGQGHLIVDLPAADLQARSTDHRVFVRTSEAERLRSLLAVGGTTVQLDGPDTLTVDGMTSAEIGQRALANQILICELTPRYTTLGDTFMTLTHEATDFTAATASPPNGATARQEHRS